MPAVVLIGYLGTISGPLLMIIEFVAGFCVLGLQFGLNAVSAMMLAAIPFLLGTVACFILARLYRERFLGHGMEQRDHLESAEPSVA